MTQVSASFQLPVETFKGLTLNDLIPASPKKEIDCQPINFLSEEIFNLKEHAIVGVSPFNSYFTVSNLEVLLRWATYHFKEVTVFIPDKISIFTLLSMGYSENEALRKTKKQDAYLTNKVIRTLGDIGFSHYESEKKILKISRLFQNKKYNDIYKETLKKFENDPKFREGCLSTSRWVLENKFTSEQKINHNLLDIAVKYFLHEFPLFLDSLGILGIQSSLFIYNSIPKFLKHIYDDHMKNSRKQGFLIVNV